ncbi:hypothetical protein CB1_000677006 [Camelus ferus]|nr:hypothetical protein CB1_000677006 [Camelus ferus]
MEKQAQLRALSPGACGKRFPRTSYTPDTAELRRPGGLGAPVLLLALLDVKRLMRTDAFGSGIDDLVPMSCIRRQTRRQWKVLRHAASLSGGPVQRARGRRDAAAGTWRLTRARELTAGQTVFLVLCLQWWTWPEQRPCASDATSTVPVVPVAIRRLRLSSAAVSSYWTSVRKGKKACLTL